MNARTPPTRYEPGLSKCDLLDAWELSLSRQLVEHEGGCLEWTGPVDQAGVGTCHTPVDLVDLLGINRTQTIIQALWLCRYGRLSNFKLMAACRSPWCVAPEHRLSMGFGRSQKLHVEVKAARQRGEAITGLDWRIALRETIERKRAKGRRESGSRTTKRRRLNRKQRTRELRRKAAWAKRNPERVKERQRQWRARNLDAQRLRERVNRRAYYYRNLEVERARARERQRALRADPVQRERINARRRDRQAAKRLQTQGAPP